MLHIASTAEDAYVEPAEPIIQNTNKNQSIYKSAAKTLSAKYTDEIITPASASPRLGAPLFAFLSPITENTKPKIGIINAMINPTTAISLVAGGAGAIGA